MTALGRREPRFFDITRVTALGSSFYAMSGIRQTVIVAENVSGLATVVGETADLGAEARDVAVNDGDLAILTDDGLRIATLADTPVVLHTSLFDPGDGHWVFSKDDLIVAPLGTGVQVLDEDGNSLSTSFPHAMASCAGAALDSSGFLYVADQERAKIHLFLVEGEKISYVDSFRAQNCRNVVKVVLDEADEVLYVVCKRRIVAFSLEDGEVTKISEASDQGGDFTDMVAVDNGFWIGLDKDTPLLATEEFRGRQFGAWDDANATLILACPDYSYFAASNVVPYVEDIGEIEDITEETEEPEVETPPAPVITSDLSVEVDENTLFTYTITATGTGPITYGVISPPAWLTSINAITGVISGTTGTVSMESITITATNAGGTDTETLEVTVGLVPIITSPLTASATPNSPFSYTITATGSAPLSFGATNLPAGLSVDSVTGVISGTPTVAAVTNVGISATNAIGVDNETLVLTAAYGGWNPADKDVAITLSGSNFTAENSTSARSVRGVTGHGSGHYYFEITTTTPTGLFNGSMMGLAKATANLATYPGGDANGWSLYLGDGRVLNNAAGPPFSGQIDAPAIIGVEYNNGDITFYWAGFSAFGSGLAFTGVTGTLFPIWGSVGVALHNATINTGGSLFSLGLPTGALPWG